MKHSLLLASLIASPVLIASPIWADANIGGKTIDCYCTDTQGARVELGQTICLFVDGKAFMATCDMSLNVPIWRRTSEGCLSSFVDQSQPLQSFDPGIYPAAVDLEITATKS